MRWGAIFRNLLMDSLDLALQLSRTFPAPRERVFQAWTNADALKQWFAPVGFKTVLAEVDLRIGGRYRLGLQDSGAGVYYVSGVYREIEHPTKLVFTWAWEAGDGSRQGETLVTIQFVSHKDATQIVLTHENLPNEAAVEQHRGGWTGCFEGLMIYLRG
jgi:uncharacterized protein YndB with AHSA1/START domain